MEDAAQAHQKATANGAVSRVEPVTLKDEASGTEQVVSEVHLYGDVVLRFVSGSYKVHAHCETLPIHSFKPLGKPFEKVHM